ncbi:MAG TPA: class I SAM-dependent methyltransferase [Verrucomicrobia bacterium]|nr:class I SAM-dependent methyltransferase [Verrucomicrobiota bacterium]HOP98253.1 class I SAM-dependent methyltransferase [Verrucomicrobiota bacterium]
MPQTAELPPDRVAPHRPLAEFYPEPAIRTRFLTELFDHAAPDYDFVSGIMSLWTDRAYRKQALRRAGLAPGMKLLDVACGTGLVIKAALELGLPPGDIMGVDPSRGMLEQGRRRQGVALLQGRGERIPARDGSFDFVSMGYALRHVEDLRTLFDELHRVLKPGGRLLIMEITRPSSATARRMMRFYMTRVMPWVGWVRSRNRFTAKMMEYYWATIEECVPPEVILSTLAAANFSEVRRTTTGPLLSDYLARKPSASA